jgi:quaternary ammonium compound-resistance protein SugE
MAWVYLFVAGLLEILWAYTMKQSMGFTTVP